MNIATLARRSLATALVSLCLVGTAQAQRHNPNQIVLEAPYDAFERAAMLIGKEERRDRQELRALFRSTIGDVDPVVTPWCAGFVDAMLIQAGERPLGTLWARDFLKYGTPVGQPAPGDIVVLTRGPVNGHVGFFHRFVQATDGKWYVAVLGGNTETLTDQGSVNIGYFPLDRVLGYRRI